MMEDISKHMVAARAIDWEMEYGTATYNLEMGGSAATPATAMKVTLSNHWVCIGQHHALTTPPIANVITLFVSPSAVI
jgi:hypothetical protein